MNKSYPLLLSRIFDQPLMIEKGKLDVILHSVLSQWADIRVENFDVKDQRFFNEATSDADFQMALTRRNTETFKSDDGFLVAGNTAIIRVHGTLVHRNGTLNTHSGMLGYDGVTHQLNAALDDGDIENILLSIDSPGGEVHGVFDLAERIFNARSEKPIIAFADDVAASAAYLLGAAAEKFYVSQTSITGSVGVVISHVEWSQAAEKAGIAHSYIFAGDHKVDGNPWEPLPVEVREKLQHTVDVTYDMFVSAVSRFRDVTEQLVRDTQANVFIGSQGVENDLVDGMSTFDAILREQISTGPNIGQSLQASEVNSMDKSASSNTVTVSGDTAPLTVERIVNEHPDIAGELMGIGATQERERIKSVTGSDDFKGREELANHLLFNTEQDADEILATLKVTPASARNNFVTGMNDMPNPDVGADVDLDDVTANASPINTSAIYEKRRVAVAASR